MCDEPKTLGSLKKPKTRWGEERISKREVSLTNLSMVNKMISYKLLRVTIINESERREFVNPGMIKNEEKLLHI